MNISLPELDHFLRGLIASVPSALLIILAAVILHVLISRALTLVANRLRFTQQEFGPVRRAVKWIVVVVTGILVLSAFGVNVGGVWGVFSTILAMIAIGFVALWSVLSNTLCTVFIILFRPFSVGDEIEFVGEQAKGRVIDLNFFFTTLDCGDDCTMQIPNSLFFQKVLRRRRTKVPVSPAEHLRTRRVED